MEERKRCGRMSQDGTRIVCDRDYNHEGQHRGYNEQIDAPMFFGALCRCGHLEDDHGSTYEQRDGEKCYIQQCLHCACQHVTRKGGAVDRMLESLKPMEAGIVFNLLSELDGPAGGARACNQADDQGTAQSTGAFFESVPWREACAEYTRVYEGRAASNPIDVLRWLTTRASLADSYRKEANIQRERNRELDAALKRMKAAHSAKVPRESSI